MVKPQLGKYSTPERLHVRSFNIHLRFSPARMPHSLHISYLHASFRVLGPRL